LTPKRMTLNDLEWSFSVKIGPSSASNGLAFWNYSEITVSATKM